MPKVLTLPLILCLLVPCFERVGKKYLNEPRAKFSRRSGYAMSGTTVARWEDLSRDLRKYQYLFEK